MLEYYQAITIIDAEEQLSNNRSSSFPHSTQDHREKINRELQKLAKPEHLQQQMDFEEFARIMKRGRKN